MAHYRILITDADGNLLSNTDTDCVDDRAACEVAARLLRQGGQVEMWDGSRGVRLASIHEIPDPLQSVH